MGALNFTANSRALLKGEIDTFLPRRQQVAHREITKLVKVGLGDISSQIVFICLVNGWVKVRKIRVNFLRPISTIKARRPIIKRNALKIYYLKISTNCGLTF